MFLHTPSSVLHHYDGICPQTVGLTKPFPSSFSCFFCHYKKSHKKKNPHARPFVAHSSIKVLSKSISIFISNRTLSRGYRIRYRDPPPITCARREGFYCVHIFSSFWDANPSVITTPASFPVKGLMTLPLSNCPSPILALTRVSENKEGMRRHTPCVCTPCSSGTQLSYL